MQTVFVAKKTSNLFLKENRGTPYWFYVWFMRNVDSRVRTFTSFDFSSIFDRSKSISTWYCGNACDILLDTMYTRSDISRSNRKKRELQPSDPLRGTPHYFYLELEPATAPQNLARALNVTIVCFVLNSMKSDLLYERREQVSFEQTWDNAPNRGRLINHWMKRTSFSNENHEKIFHYKTETFKMNFSSEILSFRGWLKLQVTAEWFSQMFTADTAVCFISWLTVPPGHFVENEFIGDSCIYVRNP